MDARRILQRLAALRRCTRAAASQLERRDERRRAEAVVGNAVMPRSPALQQALRLEGRADAGALREAGAVV
ncbi:MAG TPA: hypothetical protein VFP52_04775, partial [Myxococcales bacterium]|nr:hypothetical protein [Myxococcales bacterium]